MKTIAAVAFFFCSFLSLQAQEKCSLLISASNASTYPARLAYEVIDDRGKSLKVGYVELKSSQQKVSITLELTPVFGVQVYEDANRNSKMDRGIFTQPKERYAFSNGAWKTLGKPDVKEMLVKKMGTSTHVHFQLKSVTDF
jgi:uncharacterized protein (DUF2141 family)